MRKHQFIIGLVLGMSLAVAGSRVEAKEKPFHASFAGTTVNKDDFGFTGTTGGQGIVAGKSTLGHYTAQLVYEVPSDGKTCSLPNGGSGPESVFVGEEFVVSFAATEEQLFLRLSTNVSSHGCFDLTTGVFSGRTTFDVVGGTGRFEKATGTIVKTFQSTVLALPPAPGKGIFTSFTGTLDGSINFAK